MIILVRVRNVKGRCRIPGYEVGWFEVDQVKYGIQNDRPGSEAATGTRGTASFEKLTIEKTLDNATTDLMFQGCKGAAIASVEVQMVETAKGGKANFPFLMLRFEDVFLFSWDLDLQVQQAKETVEFDYKKVAIEYHSTKDGYTYLREGNQGWDISRADGEDKSLGTSWTHDFKQRGDRALGPGG